jgi:hypothetical protein
MLKPFLRVLIAAGANGKQLSRICSRLIGHFSTHPSDARIQPLVNREPLERIVARWANHLTYLRHGEPIRLRIAGAKPNFRSLVRSAAPNYPASLALRDLKRSGVIRRTRDGKLRLTHRFYPVRSRGAVDIELFTKMMMDFLRAHEFNFLNNPSLGHGLFQRIAHNLNSDARLAPTFNKYAREQGQIFLEAIDEWLVRHQPRKRSTRPRKRVRLGVGIYVINEALR